MRGKGQSGGRREAEGGWRWERGALRERGGV